MPGFAVLFPGQGSQYVGMGQDLYDSSPAARTIFEAADRVCGKPLTRVLFEGPAEVLTDTAYAQPALFVMSLACWAALREALADGPELEPAFAAGHSVGEYAALTIAGAIAFADALQLVCQRGQAMRAAGETQPGRMAAILGLNIDVVERICREASQSAGEPVVVANDNAPGQIVISGSSAAVQAASEMAKAEGAKRVIPLAVSIAAHSPLMEAAMARFSPALRQVVFQAPRVSVIGNRYARPLATAEEVVSELDAQLTSQVRWTSSIRYIVEQGASAFVELGPKDVLTGLVRRIAPPATCLPCGTVSDVARAAQFLREQAHRA